VRALFDQWGEKKGSRNKTGKESQRRRDKYLAPWLDRKAADLTEDDAQKLHAKIARENGPIMANRVLELVRVLWRTARLPVVTAGVERFRQNKRDRFLQGDELPRFFAALDAEPRPMIRDFLFLALLTGCSRSNVQAMAWADLDLDRAVWRVPTTKNGNPVHVALVPAAVACLRQRLADRRGDNPWVFPSWGSTGHLVDPNARWRRVLEKAGLEDFQLHDLRRSLGSWATIT
jgi:integrase